MNTNTTSYTLHDSPIGKILLAGTTQGIQHITFFSAITGESTNGKHPEAGWQQSAKPFGEACKQLDEYFAGTRTEFDLRLAAAGTDFQQQVWKRLIDIPYGETCSYGDIASQLDNPNACRAVGAANGANPLPIIVPCHRVIGANGKLTGFTGGLVIKDWLLAHERGEQSLFSFNEMQLA